MTPSVPELDSIETVRSQVVLHEPLVDKSCETVMDELMEFISKPSGSWAVSKGENVITPRIGMSLEKVKSYPSKQKILDARVYSYDEMVEVEFKISPMEPKF